ncbi:hypothetical protein NDU88_004840 [Pleurodeles waltl]|uniref:Lamina-associated polypeptide 2 alpha C-terminal domain-containing protein n=1 Tax=Pleurodeles waltl TaxID=8319 RepID=A0AAV7LS67_PLEWA|nr:hypothetical protein NDU88_004840 [Pleurodeles waltl]
MHTGGGVPMHGLVSAPASHYEDNGRPEIPALWFMAKLYLLQDMQRDLPDSIPIDPFLASLMEGMSLAEDAVIKDSVDKMIDTALRKVYFGLYLSLQATIYGTYVAQSLITDIKALYQSMVDVSDISGLLEQIKHQVEYMPDISFDVVRTTALSGGACIAARCNLVLKAWSTDSAQKASTLMLPFQGSHLFGAELEEKLDKLFKEKKHSSSLKQPSSDKLPVNPKSPFCQPSKR